jgi:hypothetical protein
MKYPSIKQLPKLYKKAAPRDRFFYLTSPLSFFGFFFSLRMSLPFAMLNLLQFKLFLLLHYTNSFLKVQSGWGFLKHRHFLVDRKGYPS